MLIVLTSIIESYRNIANQVITIIIKMYFRAVHAAVALSVVNVYDANLKCWKRKKK